MSSVALLQYKKVKCRSTQLAVEVRINQALWGLKSVSDPKQIKSGEYDKILTENGD